MNTTVLNSIVKKLVLTTTEIGTSFAVAALLKKAIYTVAPNAKVNWTEDMSQEDMFKSVIKVLGVAVVISIVAAAAANYARTMVEDTFWYESMYANHSIIGQMKKG